MDHNYRTPEDCKGTDCHPCNVCEGGLSICKACHGVEGCLTSECPGSPTTWEQRDAVYNGNLDYRNGAWCNSVSRHCPKYHSTREST